MTTRSTTTRDQHRAVIRRTKPDCGICGQPIDYDMPYLDPMSYTVDHIVPWSHGGDDTIDNKQAAHRICNRMKSNKLEDETKPKTFITSRTW